VDTWQPSFAPQRFFTGWHYGIDLIGGLVVTIVSVSLINIIAL